VPHQPVSIVVQVPLLQQPLEQEVHVPPVPVTSSEQLAASIMMPTEATVSRIILPIVFPGFIYGS
jgi:hypothetical protein